MKYPAFIIIIIGFLISNSCSKDLPYYKTNLTSCINQTQWDSLSISQQLIGKWNWDYINCPEGGYESEEDYKGLSLEFVSDGHVFVFQNNVPTDTSTWQVTSGPDFRLSTDPGVEQTRGSIEFCENHVLFNESGIDLCINYFTKN